MNEEQTPHRKTQEHAEAQRDRILDAAEQCFIEHGFHAASMSGISAKARMSAGLIYRYFENKNAIIQAIIERQLQERRADIARLQTRSELAERIKELYAAWKNGDTRVMSATLFLEMSAEASRDPAISKALENADRLSRADFLEWLEQSARGQGIQVAKEEILRRSFTLQCFIEGLAIRALREPQTDPAILTHALELILPCLLSFEEK